MRKGIPPSTDAGRGMCWLIGHRWGMVLTCRAGTFVRCRRVTTTADPAPGWPQLVAGGFDGVSCAASYDRARTVTPR